jgi:hypothetical protein
MLKKISNDRRGRQIERTRGGSQVSGDHIGQLRNIIFLVIRDADIMSGELHICNSNDVTPASTLFRKWGVSKANPHQITCRFKSPDRLILWFR